MSAETENKNFYNHAMRSGTMLGLLWIAMYASCIAGIGSPIFSLFFLVLMLLPGKKALSLTGEDIIVAHASGADDRLCG